MLLSLAVQVLLLAVLLTVWTEIPSPSWQDRHYTLPYIVCTWVFLGCDKWTIDNVLVDWTIYFNGYIILSSSPWPHLAGLWDVWPGGDLCGEGGSDTNVSGGQISCSKAGSTLHESWTWPWEPNGFDDRRRFCESSSKLCSRSVCCKNMATSKFIFLQVSNPLISNVSCYLSSFRQGQLWAWWCEEIGKMVGYPYGPWSVHHLLRWILEPPVGQHALQLEIVSFQVFEMAIALGAGTLKAMMIKMNHSVILCI